MKHQSTCLLTSLFLAFLSVYAACAYAENKNYANDNWLDWQENEVTSFPAFDLKKSTPIDIDPQSQLRWYVDPGTVSVDEDRIVRYVVL